MMYLALFHLACLGGFVELVKYPPLMGIDDVGRFVRL